MAGEDDAKGRDPRTPNALGRNTVAPGPADTLLDIARVLGNLQQQADDLRARLERVEALAQHQAGIVIALYNSVNQLGSLMLHVNQATAQTITHVLSRREQPDDLLLPLKSEMDAFSASLSDLAHRLDLMNEHLS